jgi:hypothetical protein
MDAKQFRLVLALLAAALVGYHIGSSNEETVPTTKTVAEVTHTAASAPEQSPRQAAAPKEAKEPPFEFTRQYAMDREVAHYSPWAQPGGYQFRPIERAQQGPQRYQPRAHHDRRFDAEGLSAPIQPRAYQDRRIDPRFRPPEQRRERAVGSGDYRPMSSIHASQFVQQL